MQICYETSSRNMYRMDPNISDLWALLKSVFASSCTYVVSQLYPIHDYLKIIMLFAAINTLCGWYADSIGWSFKKAFKAFYYLAGYIGLLILIYILGLWTHMDEASISEYVSWVTYALLYFYGTNIFRNWHLKQPDNKPIAFLYWVVTFKILENIKYLKDFKEYQEKNKIENDEKD